MRNLLLITILGFSMSSQADQLSETEIFYRCYGHMVNQRVHRSHPLLKDIKDGKISGEQACLSILKKGKLNANRKLPNVNDREAKSVLRNFTKLHMTFFQNKELRGPNGIFTRVKTDLYDEQGSALFYTRALFGASSSDSNITTVLKGNNDLEGVRTMGRPGDVGYASNINKDKYTYVGPSGAKPALPNVTFVETGDLIGLKGARVLEIPNGDGFMEGGKNILNSLGGGLLGAKSYMARSVAVSGLPNPDGADKMNRVWANVVLKDFLCKSLPAVRLIDGQPYKKKDATSAFRKSDGCIQCHATMDRLAAGGRGLTVRNLTRDNGSATNPQTRVPIQRKIDRPKAHVWPKKADALYYRRPPEGALYFRSYNGDLVHKPFNNIDQLASKILETDDYYACVAKKYYEYFTGVDVSLADIEDPFTTISLNEQDLFHRKQVIGLGEKLRKNKSTYSLVEDILKSPVYQSEDYTLAEGK